MFCRYKDTEIREGSTVGNVVRKTTLSLAVALACVGSNWANALSLGEIRVLSHLAEPFRAEISLPIANPEELDELRVQLAPEQVFEQAGLDRAALVGTLNFSLQKRPDGSPYIWVQSNDVIKDLGLSFYVEARWRGGNIVRGYEILLNPTPIRVIPRAVPNKVESPPTETVTPPVTQVSENARAEEPAITPIQSELGPRPTRDSNRVSKPDDKGVKFGPTLPGDILSDIARRIDPEVRYSRNLLMRAMLQQNPEAFTDGDPGKLKAGYTLHIEDLSAVPTLAGQTSAIPIPMKGGAPTTRIRPVPASGGAADSAPPPATPKTPTVETPVKPAPVKPLAIETPNNADAQDSRATLEENLASTRHEVEVTKKNAEILQSQNDALRARITELEKQVKQVAGTVLTPKTPKSADEKAPTTAIASTVTDDSLVLPQAPLPVAIDTTPPIPPPPAKIEDFWIIFGAIAAITFLLLGFLGLRPEAREKIAEFWRTKIRREPTDHNVVHVD